MKSGPPTLCLAVVGNMLPHVFHLIPVVLLRFCHTATHGNGTLASELGTGGLKRRSLPVQIGDIKSQLLAARLEELRLYDNPLGLSKLTEDLMLGAEEDNVCPDISTASAAVSIHKAIIEPHGHFVA